ncbi:MAG: ATP-binding protein [Candidatus Methanoplasma sp.]|jgi:predicted AAA+ superfamily ATPase|nr:ATP-binding protein [Candidatus Methanoplasma sp.]
MTNGEVKRERYLAQLRKFRDRTEFAKVITGVRRCGKSTLLKQFAEELVISGVSEYKILFANFESDEFSHIKDRGSLFEFISSGGKGRTYVFLDEVQRVDEWEYAVASALVDLDVDIYITGSNAYLLSSDLTTYLAGRHIEIPMFPLSFGEFVELNGYTESETRTAFREYLKRGSFPIVSGGFDDESAQIILCGIYSDIVLKDIVQRDKIRDGALLERITKFVLSNTGNLISPGSVAKVLGHKNSETIDTYLSLLCSAFVVYKAERYDLRDKHVLLSQGKYYCVDTGMRNAVLGRSLADTGRLAESVVFLELRRRGYAVTVGKFMEAEIDFTAVRGDDIKHIQVTESLSGEGAREREVAPFRMLNDHHEKIILTTDGNTGPMDGIKCLDLAEWLLDDGQKK